MRLLLRLALVVGAISGLGLLGLLAWSTGNASRFARYYDVLLILNGIFALALFVWVVALTVRLARQIRRRQFGARLTARFALAFALIGVVPGALIYTVSVQFMSRSIESWFNVRVDTALEAGLNLGRAALDSQLADLDARARSMAVELNRNTDVGVSLAPDAAARGQRRAGGHGIHRQRADGGVFHQSVWAAAAGHAAGGGHESAAGGPRLLRGRGGRSRHGRRRRRAAPARHHCADRPRPLRQPAQRRPEPRWLQLLQPVPEQIAHNANQVQQGFRDYQELALSRLGLRKLYGITLTLALLLAAFGAIAVALSLSSAWCARCSAWPPARRPWAWATTGRCPSRPNATKSAS